MEKKTITVLTKPQEVEIEGNLITNDELKKLWQLARGGNASQDNIELMRHLAVNVVKDPEIVRALHYRAVMLEEAIDMIKDMIRPKDQVDEVLVLTPENKSETTA